MEYILKYFHQLSEKQIDQFSQLKSLYEHWNSQINVISRKDIDELYLKHVLHSLSIARLVQFSPGTKILDIGTGGGFPGIPLAILFPDCHFHLTDSIGKKIIVVQEVIKALGLENVKAENIRSEKVKDQYDFIITRAVAPLLDLKHWARRKFKSQQQNKLLNGLICLKGGDISQEIKESGLNCKCIPIKKYFNEDFFDTKLLVYVKAF